VQLVICPIVREADGLALSSRNVYLNEEERRQALALSRGLKMASQYFYSGAKDCNRVDRLKDIIGQETRKEPLAEVDYIEILDGDTLDDISFIGPGKKALAAVAVKFGKTRLIDNAILELKEV
jgi:pantoate--beta-alanine ligase